jgi:hypothetical protein
MNSAGKCFGGGPLLSAEKRLPSGRGTLEVGWALACGLSRTSVIHDLQATQLRRTK